MRSSKRRGGSVNFTPGEHSPTRTHQSAATYVFRRSVTRTIYAPIRFRHASLPDPAARPCRPHHRRARATPERLGERRHVRNRSVRPELPSGCSLVLHQPRHIRDGSSRPHTCANPRKNRCSAVNPSTGRHRLALQRLLEAALRNRQPAEIRRCFRPRPACRFREALVRVRPNCLAMQSPRSLKFFRSSGGPPIFQIAVARRTCEPSSSKPWVISCPITAPMPP